ncbi:RCC1 domain-containing protein 1-like isoform X2 [Polypterus senegalus]|uniref:RCC1 domain-containing protein 1-like isoform X2 n=1 Tax=Polypterus senegalus TaxID=55291 RepID=UPI001963DB30|nr:RCC1 domain-containing protein 1-like isoform X2 [Polypterus senegalus]
MLEWFGFGFNQFGQITPIVNGKEKILLPQKIQTCNEFTKEVTENKMKPTKSDAEQAEAAETRARDCGGQPEATESRATESNWRAQVSENRGLERSNLDCGPDNTIRVSWSRRATLHRAKHSPCAKSHGDKGRICLYGFCSSSCGQYICLCTPKLHDCLDAMISENYLVVKFKDKIESWNIEAEENNPVWSMDITPSFMGDLPLAPGGYVVAKPPFYKSIHMPISAKKLSLGEEHVVLLSTDGTVYTWGMGSHGQLGHGTLESQLDPLAVEALHGLKMADVSAGSWHSACISDGGDMYTWGWNESGQLGLPSRCLQICDNQSDSEGEADMTDIERTEGSMHEDDSLAILISIQAFPALLDVPGDIEFIKMSCGSRHTAAVTCDGDLYTWGWGKYGQLGHDSIQSADQPKRVEYFAKQQFYVQHVVCGAWNTFAQVSKTSNEKQRLETFFPANY